MNSLRIDMAIVICSTLMMEMSSYCKYINREVVSKRLSNLI